MHSAKRLVLLGLVSLFVTLGTADSRAYAGGDWCDGHRLVYHHHHLGYWVRHDGDWRFVRISDSCR
jgi:hypothetical protein